MSWHEDRQLQFLRIQCQIKPAIDMHWHPLTSIRSAVNWLGMRQNVPGAHVTTIVLLLLANLKLRSYWWQTESIFILRARSQIHIVWHAHINIVLPISCGYGMAVATGFIEIWRSSMPGLPLLHHQGLCAPNFAKTKFAMLQFLNHFGLLCIPHFLAHSIQFNSIHSCLNLCSIYFATSSQPDTNVFQRLQLAFFSRSFRITLVTQFLFGSHDSHDLTLRVRPSAVLSVFERESNQPRMIYIYIYIL